MAAEDAPGVDPQLRASDRDREKAVTELRMHHAAGRLDDDELEERIDVAYAARTVGPLYDVLRDLPVLRLGAVEPIRPRVIEERGFGVRSFHQEHELPAEPMATWDSLVASLLPGLLSLGFVVVDRATGAGVALARAGEHIAVELEPRRGGGTRLIVHGRARRRVRRTFASLSAR